MSNLMPNQSDIEFLMPLLSQYARENPVVLEIGCGLGNGSTRALAQGINEALVQGVNVHEVLLVSVDLDPSRPLEEPPERWWHKVTGDSRDSKTVDKVRELVADVYYRPKLIFIDTEHSKEQIEVELQVWGKISTGLCVWLFHDTWMWGNYNPMTDAIREYAQTHGLVYEDITRESHGLGKMSKGPGDTQKCRMPK